LAAGGKSVFIWEVGCGEPFGNKSAFSCNRNLEIFYGHPLPISMENAHVPKEPVLLIALMIMRHAKLSFGDHVPYLRMLFGTQKGCIGHCLIVGRGGRFDLLKV
jgi:hypothetical protein